jgi:NADH:ubiquinone oxidoreductase subunit H
VRQKKIYIYIFLTHFNKSVAESYMTGNCHVWFGGRRNQLSTPTFDYGMVLSDLNVGILYLFAISSLGVYGIITAGWSSNSKYAFLGALRSAAQMVSYEVSIGLIIITVLICVGSCNFSEIVIAQKQIWFGIPLFPVFIMFFISCLAETNRAPFDLPEAEAELVAGYNVEYSSMGFALSFSGEYANMILMRCGALHLTFVRL